MIKKNKYGLVAIFIIILIPLIIWLNLKPISDRFSSANTTFTSVGQVLALLGIGLFSLTFVLNTRLKFLENYFGGQDKIYRYHHMLGTFAFVFLLFHPLFLAANFLAISVTAAASFFIPSTNWALNFGQIALLLLEIFLILTFFVKLRYHNWRFTHQFLGLAFVFASIHILLIQSDVARSNILRYYIIFLISIGLLSYIYRTILGSKLVKKLSYKVEATKSLGRDITEITLSPLDNALNFLAGQFIFISFITQNISSETHPFTISSSPRDKNIRLSIKSSGDFTSQINKIQKGSIAKIEGPFGKFSYEFYRDEPQIWVAGGIGVTPFLSFARSLNNNNNFIDLYYSVRSSEEAIFLEELQQLSSKNSKFRLIPHFSLSQGHINAEFIKNQSQGLESKEIFICGPPPLMKSLIDQFLKMKINKKNIHYEEFSLK
ncbi:ferric reductase-like transmembrane domain-containing protein [Candidatus Woesearchaeota archaeon]|nr:ferric reductase-like transmembrane domain-containing protein [Candidatus Woesearchaeota archaeon]